jgi:antitoxin (DNA-binding transcriptional repressor) of toxin-antitoxin stability system
MSTHITATDLGRNLRSVLDRVAFGGEEMVVSRNQVEIARILPGTGRMTALEAMADLYRTIDPAAAETWQEDGRGPGGVGRGDGLHELRDPWES